MSVFCRIVLYMRGDDEDAAQIYIKMGLKPVYKLVSYMS